MRVDISRLPQYDVSFRSVTYLFEIPQCDISLREYKRAGGLLCGLYSVFIRQRLFLRVCDVWGTIEGCVELSPNLGDGSGVLNQVIHLFLLSAMPYFTPVDLVWA
jgi:hypothetical protein